MWPSKPAGGEEPAVQVRSDFRSTIVWQPDVITGKDGKATVKVKYPDSLTGWKATARAVDRRRTSSASPRPTRARSSRSLCGCKRRGFLWWAIRSTISAVVNNNTDERIDGARRSWTPAAWSSRALREWQPVEGERPIKVPANGEARRGLGDVHVTQPGEAKLKVTARGGKYADAMEKTYTVYEHGIEKFISKSGKVRGDDVTVKLDLPKERKRGIHHVDRAGHAEHGGDDARCAAVSD